MSNLKIELEIPEDEIKKVLLDVIARKYYASYSPDRREVDRVVAECIRKIIYEDKERIVELIVARASRECKNKAIKKILEGIE